MTTQFFAKTYTGKSSKRASFALAALAVASLFLADIAPAVAQTAPGASTRPSGGSSSSTVPGGPDGGGDSGMPSVSCNDFGFANMPSGCLSQAMSCICPNEVRVGYRAPSSCEGVGRNMRRAAERNCGANTGAVRRVF
ncbi:hypothetical protein K32_12460 [Kaistia sp. 32K]|uniref:hypothetical protein n=1 Tax=Kaistia sp. 32K TaxID=2795690 RepID=UPI00191680BD|nr:hypothetical protein [Kaistia sp. 32K]BCP52629.1 hypothetical protein K32_12460 [Kaistia sp. 32K]